MIDSLVNKLRLNGIIIANICVRSHYFVVNFSGGNCDHPVSPWVMFMVVSHMK